MIILDTNVISKTLRDNPAIAVLNWMDLQDPSSLFLTTVTMAEMEYGMRTMPRSKRREALGTALYGIFELQFRQHILSFDHEAARLFGIHMAAAKLSGHSISQSDVMIAAIALAHRPCQVATRDATPFAAMGVEVLNPWHEA